MIHEGKILEEVLRDYQTPEEIHNNRTHKEIMSYSNPYFIHKEFKNGRESLYSTENIKRLHISNNSKTIEYFNYTDNFVIVTERTGISRLFTPLKFNDPNLHNNEEVSRVFRSMRNIDTSKFLVKISYQFSEEMDAKIFKNWISSKTTKLGTVLNDFQQIVVNGPVKIANRYFIIDIIIDLEEIMLRRGINVFYYDFLDIILTKIDDSELTSELRDRRGILIDQLYKIDFNTMDGFQKKQYVENEIRDLEKEIKKRAIHKALNAYNSLEFNNSFPYVSVNPQQSFNNIEKAVNNGYTDFRTVINLIDSSGSINKLFLKMFDKEPIEILPNKDLTGKRRNGLYIEIYRGYDVIQEYVSLENKSLDEFFKELKEFGVYPSKQECLDGEVQKLMDVINKLKSQIEDITAKHQADLRRKDDEFNKEINKKDATIRNNEDEIRKLNVKIEEMKLEDKERERIHKENMRGEDVKQKEKENKYDFWKRALGIVKEAFILIGSFLSFLKIFKVI